MVQVREINDIQELGDVRPSWSSLLPQTARATFFQSPDWLECYWKHFGREQRLRALVVYDGQQRPTGILPLVVRRETTRVGTIRVLTYPLHDWGSFYGPVGPDPAATLRAGLEHVRRTPRDWDLVDLRWVDPEDAGQGRTQQAMRGVGWRPRRQVWAETAMIELSGTWGEYFQGRGKKWRHNVMNCGRRLARLGEVNYIRYRPRGAADGDGDPRWDLYDACVELSGRSWQGSSTDGTTLCHAEIRDFLRDTHAVAARLGAVDLNLLLCQGNPVAFSYNYHCQRQVFGLRMGFDPACAQAGPGTVLQGHILEDCFRRGDTRYDFGVCYLAGKRPWLTDVARSYRYTHFPVDFSRVQILRWKRWIQERWYGDRYVVCAKIG